MDVSEEDISEVNISEDGIGRYFYAIALGNKYSITFSQKNHISFMTD